ncbi:hypothetical protein [Limibacterium fermenti]|jgi:predicted RNA-binding Zn-ribbon protein involved in translation (DUF1610 family)|uniref:hypothetical protein n=1 Tax=Limibacterium fermenti TaxID=3229863 RepID=UPI000E952A38|nr:hypothetical protein [Porphyromonadaceae bacterium]HBX44791.1 hypothetical protein [Porphyromonadaceae bacterium]HCM20233.1 hypothetical protein [Porphyromonadaceae bacterium]
MKKHADKPNRKHSVEPLFPHTRIYRMHCPHCGAEVDYTLEMQYHKKLICLSCGKDVPNPLYDLSDPYNIRRRARRYFRWFIIGMALIGLLGLGLSSIYRDYPPKVKPSITINSDEWLYDLHDYRQDMDSMRRHKEMTR